MSSGRGTYAQLETNDAAVSRLAQQDKVPWYEKPNLRLLYLLMFPTCLGAELTNGYDISVMNALQAVPSWVEYFHCPRSASLGLMVSMHPLGMVAAVPLAPFVVDKYGRRFSLLLGGIIAMAGGILQGCALEFVMFTIARFMLGFACTFSIVAASCLIGELSHPKERATMGCLFFVSFYLGSIVSAGLTLATFAMSNDLGWRIPSLFQIVPSLIQITSIRFIPESPRWLISVGKKSEALTFLVKYHAEGNKDSEFVKAEYAQIDEIVEVGLKISRLNYMHVFSTPGMRKRVVITIFLGLSAQWSGLALISPFLSPILDTVGIHDDRTKNIINLARSSWGLVCGIVISLVVPKYPRRRMYLLSTISLFVLLSTFTAASADYSINHSSLSTLVVLAVIFLHSPAHVLAVGSLNYTFLAELFPFHVRASGMSLYQWWNRGGAFFSMFVNPIGIDAMGWKWYIVYCVWCAFQIVFVYTMLPETAGRTLEELMFLFEEDREVLGHGGVETLYGQVATESYGAVEDHPRGTARPTEGGQVRET